MIVIVEIGIFGILAAVGGAECLSAIRFGTLSIEGAISIIMVLALFIGFFGYRCLHILCQYIWIPNLFGILVLVGCAARGLSNQAEPPSNGAAPYLSTIAICAGNMATCKFLCDQIFVPCVFCLHRHELSGLASCSSMSKKHKSNLPQLCLN